jgi:DNA (cytosine-5)-methyltransferase 1
VSANRITICSFFSGGGLFDLAFKNNGSFNIIWANEFNPHAAKCYQYNIGNHIKIGDINQIPLNLIPSADMAIGGPPCTTFSTDGAGRGEWSDTGKLIWKYCDIIRVKQFKVFILENVTGLVSRHKNTFKRLLTAFQNAGYNITTRILNAADFGVAQNRKRVIMVGIRKDLRFTYEFPDPPMITRTVREAISDLPTPETVEVKDAVLGSTPNHVATWTSPTVERIEDIIKNPRPRQRRGIRRLPWDKPSFTITAHIGKDGREYIHPAENRRITVRETLRCMGVPDDFVIPAKIPLRQQYFIAGNGVPTEMASYLAEEMYQQLGNRSEKITA